MMMQAVMQLIQEGKYISWSLPKYSMIVTSSNPDDGENQVTALDEAQQSRLIKLNLKFNSEEWAAWAENSEIDGRAINFALSYPEIFEKQNNVQIANARSYTNFCNVISGIPDWADQTNLSLILNLASGCFSSDENNFIGNMFTTFIHNRLDKLIQPHEMLFGDWEKVKKAMKDAIYADGKYKNEMAAMLGLRLLNYTLHYLSKTGSDNKQVTQRLIDFIECDEKLMSVDLVFHIVKTVYNKYKNKMGKLLTNKNVHKALVG